MSFSEEPRAADPAFFAFSAEVRAALRPDDRFLVSYPRSGNTWMRYVLTAGCALQAGEDLPLSAEGVARVLELTAGAIPDLHEAVPTGEPPPLTRRPYRIIKSHNVREVAAHNVVYLFRRPEDSLLSYAHYAKRAGAGADRFVFRELRTWASEAEFALGCHLANPERFFLVSYERLLERTAESVAAIARHLGLTIDEVNVERAVALNDFRRLKSFEQTGAKKLLAPSGMFFRRGKTGAGRTELRPETVAAVEKYATPVYERLSATAV